MRLRISLVCRDPREPAPEPPVWGDFGPDKPAEIFLRKDAVRSGFSEGRVHRPRASSAGSATREHPRRRVARRRAGGRQGGYPPAGWADRKSGNRLNGVAPPMQSSA